jgi:hypothetical protein
MVRKWRRGRPENGNWGQEGKGEGVKEETNEGENYIFIFFYLSGIRLCDVA